ncbi:acyltransferase [Nocardioides szechwanensis]|uniref:Peptidoglycan/LPS O-acetylase OafA/YrhL, contains acyltransferase and SGNH-hydrolase domains n=1 Tax=Nocardioides szechwanensis TaxID=1005944 RepID=A0A1G9VRD8_9ACTN|nr:acyltransferase [Nocardioides szechwanensis]GEP32856.1 acyltransferase [Nocardioides szechwanensis]SDM74677.1 Peptidoglycan/LPS O-acetylase OafA/YrhL, contains acyltransferase and SGNH-hydrolase domains [Nocardioides szechwanensis]
MSADDPNAPATFPALDTMRAIAAIAVLATHASFWGGAYAQPVFGTALARLDIGVAIFFVLSGFLLARPFLSRHARGRPAPSTGRYLWKRALRILPVYVVAVVTALVLLPGNDGAGPTTWVKTLLLGNIYVDGGLPDGLTQMWSLSTEVAFYLVLPVLMWVALSRGRSGAASASRVGTLVGVLVLVNMAWVLDLAARLDLEGATPALWLPSYLTWFSVGIVLAACGVHLDQGGADGAGGWSRFAVAVREMGRLPGVCWTAGLAIFAIAATPIAGPSTLIAPTLGEALAKNLLYAAAAGLLILPGIFADPGGRYVRVLSLPLLRHLGHISYGVFCMHLVILELVARWLDLELFRGRTLELFAVTLALSLLVAELLYWLLERPAMRLKDLSRPGSRSTESSTPKATATRS